METFVKVKVESSQANPISVKLGLRQGDSKLSVLFNIILEKVTREINIRHDEGVKVQRFSLRLLEYADNLVLVEISPNRARSLFGELKTALKLRVHGHR